VLSGGKLKIIKDIYFYLESGFQIEEAIQKSNNLIFQDIQRGLSLSESLKKLDFPDFIVQNVKVGEETGKLKDILKNIVEIIERSVEFQRNLKVSMLTPFFTFSLALFIFLFVVSFVITEISQIMTDMGVSVSKSLKFVYGIGLYLRKNIYLSSLALFAIIVWLGYTLFSFRLPIFRELIVSFILRSISLCLKGGIELQRALVIVSEISNIKQIREALLKETVNLMRGKDPDFSFVPEFSEEFKKGYEAGNLSLVLERISDYMEKRSRTRLEIIKKIMDPILFLIISLIIVFIVVFMYGPMIKEMIKII